MVSCEKKNYRKEGSDETVVCALHPSSPGLTIASFFLSFLQNHILTSVNKGCVIYTLVLLLVLQGGKEAHP